MNMNISHKNLLKGVTSNYTKISILLISILLFSFCSTDTGKEGGDATQSSHGDVDSDNDGLIEISSLIMLHNMRYNLAGTSYKTSSTETGDTTGASTTEPSNCDDGNAGTTIPLCGYELTQSLNFDTGNDGTFIPTNTGDCNVILPNNSPRTDYSGCKIDDKDHNATYFPVSSGSGGWVPIGNISKSFTGIFDGNGFTISNMSIKRDARYTGLFGYTNGATIRNIGMTGGIVISFSSSSFAVYSAGLIGVMIVGSVSNSYATGNVFSSSSSSTVDSGGLVGFGGNISNSYATGNVSVFSSSVPFSSYSGGLVGVSYGSVSNSYATGNVFSSSTYSSATSGGLVGYSTGGSISNSYATGNVYSSTSSSSYSGGLVGYNSSRGGISNSYRNMDATIIARGTTTTLFTNSENNISITPTTITNFQNPTWYTDMDRWNTTAPNEAWDFTNVWQITAGQYPTLR